jgi:quinoprotein glucose dehydrogenase
MPVTWPVRVLGAILVAIGLGLAVPGGWLIWLGGSAYYVAAGLSAILAGILLWRGDGRALIVYAALLAGTIGWAIWEAGFDSWALLPRLVGPLLAGAVLAGLRRGLRGAAARTPWFPAVVICAWLVPPIGVFLATPDVTLPPPRPVASQPVQAADKDWVEYGRDKAGTRFSPLAQLTPENVSKLEPAWSFRTGVPSDLRVSLEVTPLKIRDRLYLCTGNDDIIALDAETGQQAWRFFAHVDPTGLFAGTCRGVAYYKAPDQTIPCPERLLVATVDRRLIAVDLRDGSLCAGFGANGMVSLDTGMGPIEPGYYHVTSAPQIIRGKAVFGGWVTDGQYVGEPSGVIRAFDAVTGKLAWAWDMGRPDRHGEPGPGETYTRATPNSWAPISADETLGLVYLPTGNATPDYFGGARRPLDEPYSSAVVAIDAETGDLRWSFQTTHHDLWDYDVSSQPTLVDLPDGTPALLQATKRGEIFLLDRRTGKPVAAVEERKVPQGAVPGERLAPTQPFSVGMPSFAGPMPTEARMWGITPFDQLWCRIKFREARFDGTMTPLAVDRPTVTYPGYLGGMDWGSLAVDTDRGLMVVNSNRVGNYNRLMTREEADRLGIKPFSASGHGDVGGPVAQAGTPYAVSVRPFLSPLAIPCTEPPYGMISVVDLKTRTVVWTEPFGTGEDSGPLTIPSHLPFTMGVPNIGGAVTTRGGVFFIGSAQDNYLRAYETATGRELWRARLPAGGQATPMTYWSDASNRQFVVIAAGGHGGLLTTPGDYILAFALPKDK